MVGYKKKYFDLLEKYADKDEKKQPIIDEKPDKKGKDNSEDDDEIGVEDEG